MEGTTVRVRPSTRDALATVRRETGAASLDEAIGHLLSAWVPDAVRLHREHQAAVGAACNNHGITSLTAFGSRVRSDRRPDSDLDLIAAFQEPPSLFQLARAQDDLSAAFACRVDLGTPPERGSRLAAIIDDEGVRLVP